MPSYKNLAIIALVASSVSPVLCAPTRESQKQSRAELELEERTNMELLERLGTDFALRAVSALSERSFGGTEDVSREIAELEGRAPRRKPSSGGKIDFAVEKVIYPAAVVGAAGATGYGIYEGVKQNEKNQRDVSSAQMISVLNALGERAYVPPEDSDTILHLLVRALDELDELD